MPPSPSSNSPPHIDANANSDATSATNDNNNDSITRNERQPQENTRALLSSLEDLRDNLSSRVEQLSNAVERLRSQANELERSLEGEGLGLGASANNDEGVNSSPALRELRDSTRSRQRARDIVTAFENRETPSLLPPPTSTTAAASPTAPTAATSPTVPPIIRQFARPMTTEEINTLLDRASASIRSSNNTLNSITSNMNSNRQNTINNNNNSDHNLNNGNIDPWMARAENIENRIRRLSETARELRSRANQSPSSIENNHQSSSNSNATRHIINTNLNTSRNGSSSGPGYPIRVLGPATNGSVNPYSRITSTPDRFQAMENRSRELSNTPSLYESIRNDLSEISNSLNNLGNLHRSHQQSSTNRNVNSNQNQRTSSSSGARTPQIIEAIPMSRRDRSRQASRGITTTSSPSLLSRSRGLQPTNISQLGTQPAPQIVRSNPASPAAIVQPSLPSCTITETRTHEHLDSGNNNNPSLIPPNQPVRPSAPLRNNDLMEMARNIVEGFEGLSNPLPPRNSSPLARSQDNTALEASQSQPPRNERSNPNSNNTRRDSSLTYRGRRVAAAMGEAPSPTTESDEMDENEVLRTWPFLRQFLQNTPNPPIIRRSVTSRRNGQTPTPSTPQSRSEERARQRIRETVARRQDSTDGFIPGPAHDNAGSDSITAGNGNARTRTRTNDYLSALGRINSNTNNQNQDDHEQHDHDIIEETTVVVIDLTTNPPTRQTLPRFINPQRRSTQERERIRYDRQLANERISQIQNHTNQPIHRQTLPITNPDLPSTIDMTANPDFNLESELDNMSEGVADRLMEDMGWASTRNYDESNLNSNVNQNPNLPSPNFLDFYSRIGPSLPEPSSSGINVEVDVEIGVLPRSQGNDNNNPISPTQGFSLANMDNGMEGVMRALVINSDHDDDTTEDEEEESGSEGSSNESGSDTVEGTIFEGTGERTENTQRPAHHIRSATTTTTTSSLPSRILDQRARPTVESLDTDLHLWPTHYTLAGL
ncbi:uncharacterized protein L201_002189 [Kwoniella dendrophila CBS 6074]|uniref:Uncharacterized protein n=1 Tax=Kwoniella dendrophila CBS 6074 TaxID=1295534 RepID=A0AAX4JPH7_9TREE